MAGRGQPNRAGYGVRQSDVKVASSVGPAPTVTTLRPPTITVYPARPSSNTKLNTVPTPPRLISEASSVARNRWRAAIAKVVTENALNKAEQKQQESDHRNRKGLLDEIGTFKHTSKAKESVLHVLKSQAHLTQKQFERQKYSAKEILIRKKAAGKGVPGLDMDGRTDMDMEAIEEYNRQAELLYQITPEIQIKLDKIKARNVAAEEKQKAKEEAKPGWFTRMMSGSILGQTLRANPRFYKLNPHEHLPDLCRRCRRPLINTLESHFTTVGILFLIFFPLVGLLLLYGNREFRCVICNETYVYGDLTARPEEEFDEEEVTHRKT